MDFSMYPVPTLIRKTEHKVKIEHFQSVVVNGKIVTIGRDFQGNLYEYFQNMGWLPFEMLEVEKSADVELCLAAKEPKQK